MNMNKATAWTLRIGIVIGLVLIAAGLAISDDNDLLYWGLLILISSPLFAVVVTFIGLVSEKDWFWAGIAGLVMAIVVSGAVIAMI